MSFQNRIVSCSALAALMFIGCATASSSEGGEKRSRKSLEIRQPFPTAARVAQIGETSVEQPLAVVGTMAAVTSWSVDPGVPNHDWKAPYAGAEPNAAAYAAWVKAEAPQATATASMTCLAQQYARFNAEHAGEVAGADVQAFMYARCGVVQPSIRTYAWAFPGEAFRELDPARPEPKVMEVLTNASEGALTGLGVHATDSKVFVTVAVAQPTAEFVAPPFASGGDGNVEISGVFGEPTEWLQASITHGALGAKPCERVPVAGSSGSFAFRCPTDPQDAMAMIEVAAAPKGSILGEVFARAMVSPDGSLPTTYEAPTLAIPATTGDFSSAAVLAGVNALRGQAGLPDVVGAPAQDAVSANLFPHLLRNADTAVRNEAALGLVAGWQVEDNIRQGTFEMMFTHADVPLDRALAGALLSPSFRAVALGRDTRVLSTAVLSSPETNTRGLLSVAFEVFEPGDFTTEETAVFNALDDARAKVGLPPVTRVQGGKDDSALAESAERIRTGQSAPGDELDRMLAHFRDSVGRDFYGVIYVPTRIEGWSPDFADAFFEHDNIAVATTVSYFTPPGAAWGQHVVFMVFTPL